MPPSPPSTGKRLLFIDGLRCIAVFAVILYHFTHNSPFDEVFLSSLPDWLCGIAWNGYLGVEIFFVVSGFVIALTLSNGPVTPFTTLGFAIRRYLRLAPPYLMAVLVWMATTFLGKLAFPAYDVPQPTAPQLAAHVFYLQNLFGLGDIVAPTWTLCLEFQFYLFYALCILLSSSESPFKRWLGILLLFLSTGYSLALAVFSLPTPGLLHPNRLFLGTWYLFALGAMAAWGWQRPSLRRWMTIPLLALLLCWLGCRNKALMVGILACGSILAAESLGRMGTWLSNRIVQYIGSRSFSIYLIHWVVGLRAIDLMYRFAPHTLPSALLCSLAGFALTLLASELFWRLLENPSVRLSRSLKKYFA